MKNRLVFGIIVFAVMTVMLLCKVDAEEDEGWLSHYQPTPGAEILDYIETQELFASLADKTLLAASGAGAWEGRLNVDASGGFEGYYYDADAGDEIIYEVSFSGNFAANAEVHDNTYWLWVQDLTTAQVPGTEAKSVYGDRIVYTDPPFEKDTFMVLTLIRTPAEKIPETVRDEIGGTFGEWDDYSRFVTLTRQKDGWGFFADGYESNRQEFEPIATAVPAATPTPAPDYQPVKKKLLPNGNMYYDFGLIAFEVPADCYFGMAQATGSGTDSKVTCFLRMPYRPEYENSLRKAFPLNEDVQGLPLTIANIYTLFYNKDEDVESIAWNAHEGKGYEFGVAEVAGHKAHWARDAEGAAKVNRGYITTEYLVPLSGNRILQFLVVDYDDGTLKEETELFLNTLEIRDALAVMPQAGETTPEPEQPAPGPEATTGTEDPFDASPYITYLDNGNIHFDDGVIAFDAPPTVRLYKTMGNPGVSIWLHSRFDDSRANDSGNVGIGTISVSTFNSYERLYEEENLNAERVAWLFYQSNKDVQDATEPAVTEVAGRPAYYVRHYYDQINTIFCQLGDKLLTVSQVNLDDDEVVTVYDLIMNTLVVRDGADQLENMVDEHHSPSEDPAGPGEEITYEDNGNGTFTEVRPAPAPEPEPASEPETAPEPEPEPEPKLTGKEEIPAGEWVDCWMGGGDAMGEMVTWLKEDGSLWMKVFFQRTFEIEAELKPLDWNRRSFETEYGHYSGVVTWVNERELTFAITGGMSMEDDESEWYYLFKDREYSFSPVDYNDLWYEAPAEGPEDDGDWLGNWTTLGTDMKSTIRIIRGMQGNFIMQLTFSNGYMIAGELEQADSRRMDFNTEEFSAILTLNRKHRMILLTDAGSMNDAANEALDAFHYIIEYSPEVYE